MSLRLKLILIFLAIALIPLFFVSTLTFHNYKNSLETARLSNLQDIAYFKADKIETYFNGLKENINTTQGFYNIKKNISVLTRLADDPNHPELVEAKKTLDEQLQQMQLVLQLSDIMLVNPNGKIVYSSNHTHTLKDFLRPLPDPQQKAFEEGKDKIFLSDIYLNEKDDNRPAILVTAPVSDFNGVFIGVIAFEVNMTSVYKLIQDTTGLGDTGEVLVGRKIDNQVVFLNPLRHDPQAVLKRKISFGDKIGGPIQEAVQGRNGAGQLLDYRGMKVIAAWRYIPSLNWGMVAKIDTGEAFAEVTKLRNLAIIIVVMVVILSGITALSITQSIARPLKQLAQGAEIIGSGNLDYKIGTPLKDEIGQLSRSFDKMTENLKQTLASRDELNREVIERQKAEQSLRESKEHLSTVFHTSPAGIFVTRLADGMFLEVNEAYLQIIGYSAQETLGRTSLELNIWENEEDRKKTIDILHRQGHIDSSETKFRRKNGQIADILFSAVLFEQAEESCILGAIMDVTERKRLELLLQKNLKEHQIILDSVPAMIFYKDKENHFVRTNKAFEDVMRLSRKELEGKSLFDLYPKEQAQAYWDDDKEVMASGKSKNGIIESMQTACGTRLIRTDKAPYFDESGNVIGVIGFSVDITEQRQAEEALRNSRDELEMRVRERTHELAQTVEILKNEARERIFAEKTAKTERKRFEDVLEMMPAYAILLTPDYRVAYANRTFREWFGNDGGKKCYEFLFNRTQPCEDCQTYTVMKTHKSHFWEWTGPNGRNYDIYDYPFTDTDGSPLIMEIGVDVTTHKQAQADLRSASMYTRCLLEASLDPLVTISPEGKITDVNKATEQVTGVERESLIGSDFSNYFTEPQKANEGYQKVITEGFVKDYPLTIRHTSGGTMDVLYNATVYKNEAGQVQGVFAAARDVTERKAVQQKQNVTNSLLELFARKTSRKEYLDAVVQVIRHWSDCQCIGIRLVNSDGCIPYESCVGFSDEFLAIENMISLNKDTCSCIRIIAEKPDPQESPAITPKGSFRCDNTLEFIEGLPENDRARYRGHCPRCGFASVAVIPVRYRDRVLGAIHLADREVNKISPQNVEFLENMAMLIGEALYRLDTETSLRLSEFRLMEAQRIARLGNWEWDLEKNKLWWSDEVYRIFGLKPGEFQFTFEAFLQFVHPEDIPLVKQAIDTATRLRQPYGVNHRIIRKEGVERIVHEQAEVVFDNHGKPLRMTGTVQDVTEQELAEKELRLSQEKLRSLATEIVLTEERERRTIATALHDSLGPLLAFSKRELGILRKSVPDGLTESLAYVHDKIKQAVDQTRNLTFDLSPTTLYTLGLEHALEELVEHFALEGKFNGVCYTDEVNQPLTDDIKILVYRSVRELLVNIVKHAQAKNVHVNLLTAGNTIQVTVQDDGVGFNVSKLDLKTGKLKGFGLFNIYERLTQAGGRLDIQSHESGGIKVIMQLPLSQKKEQ